jgi:trehalose-6-phosphate synthase
MRTTLKGKKLFLVSNREPYVHVKAGRSVKALVPAGGVVTALDPVMRICDGVWVAHGSGDADRETADENGKVRVPPRRAALYPETGVAHEGRRGRLLLWLLQ